MRNLANKTRDATLEVSAVINKLIASSATVVDAVKTSQVQATATVTKVQLTEQRLNAILEKVSTISEMNRQIALATTQQRQAARQVEDVASQLNGLSQQTESQFEQVVRISQGGAELSAALKKVIEQFRI